MLKINWIIVFFTLIVIGCNSVKKIKEEKVTVSFNNTGKKTPFSGCDKTQKSDFILFTDSAKTFEMKIDSDWSYSHSYSEGEVFLHSYTLKRDTSIKLTILIDPDFYEEKKGRLLSRIQPEDGVHTYNLDSDTCQWKASIMTEETDSQVKYIIENRFQYYCKSNKRLYWIFVTEEKENKTELNLNISCEFQDAIESFRSLK